MSVNVRKFKGRWMVDVRVTHPDETFTRDRKVMGGTISMARAWGLERERELISSHGKQPEPEPVLAPTFNTFSEDWLKVYSTKGLRPTTLRGVRKQIRCHLLPFFGAFRIDEITRERLDKFVSTMFGKTKGKPAEKRTSRNGYLETPKGLSAKTVKHSLSTLHRMLVAANDWGKIGSMPKFPQVKTDEATWDFYTVSESLRLIAGARDSQERLMLAFSLWTGCRAGELLAVEWDDLDLVAARVDFRRSRSEGKTSPTPKSRKGRSVPLTLDLVVMLKSHRHLKGDLVFSQPNGRPLTLWHLHGALIRASKKAGLRCIRWHELRHSWASNLAIAGTPLPQIQKWGGWSTITMVMRYAHLMPDGGREYLSALTRTGNMEATATG